MPEQRQEEDSRTIGPVEDVRSCEQDKIQMSPWGAFNEPREGLFCCEKDGISVWFKWGVMHSPSVFFRGSTLSRQKWSLNFSFQCSAQC